MKLTVVGCSPAWPNPGGAQSGYLLEGPGRLLLDCGPGVLARLRSNGKNGWPEVDAIAITHFHLDHWGDLVPWVWGRMWGLGQEYEPPELWLPPGGREELAAFGTRFGTPDMFIRVFEPKEYVEGEEFEAARPHARGDSPPALHGSDLRLPRLEQHPDARLFRATRARASDLPGSPTASTSFSAKRRSSGAKWTASREATSRPKKPWLPSKRQGRSGSCSRTGRRSSPWTAASSRHTTGFS